MKKSRSRYELEEQTSFTILLNYTTGILLNGTGKVCSPIYIFVMADMQILFFCNNLIKDVLGQEMWRGYE